MPGLAGGLSADRAATVSSNCYEAFIHIIDSMFNQHAKWLKGHAGSALAAAHRFAELSADLARLAAGSQRLHPPGSGLHRLVVNKKADIVRVYLPPDANCLLSVADHCLRSRHYVNVIVAGKQPALQWLDMEVGHRALHRLGLASGSGPATIRGSRTRRRDGLRG